MYQRLLTWSISILLLCLCYNTSIYATHIVGGEINYRCLGNDQYELTLTIFRDCDTGVPWFDNPASIGVFEGNNPIPFYDLRIPYDSTINDTLPIFLPDSCLIIPSNVCIHRTVYKDTVFLPFSTGGYTITYQRCCRNVDIVNIIDPTNTGATYWTYISPAALQICNSSPTFRELPRIYLCSGVPIAFDNSGVDLDGDSLSYELCTPFDGANIGIPVPQPPAGPPYNNIQWSPPYSQNNMFGGSDPLIINSVTGLLTGTPQNLGVFLVGVCIREYRNGNLISTTLRGFQHVVGTCEPKTVASFDTVAPICNKDLDYQFINTSQVVTGTYSWQFDNLGNSTAINPIFTFPDTGFYSVTLVAGLGSPCLDTFTRVVDARVRAIELTLDAPPINCVGDTILVTATDLYRSYNNPTNYIWTPGTAIYDGQFTDSVLVVATGSIQIQVTGTNSYGCISTVNQVLRVDRIAALFDTLVTPCNRDLSMQFQNLSVSNPTNNNYLWQFDSLGFVTGTSPSFVFPDTGIYNVTLVAGQGSLCADTFSMPVQARIRALDLLPLNNAVLCVGDTLGLKTGNLFAAFNDVVSYQWLPSSAILSGLGTDSISLIAASSTPIQVVATNNYNCTDSLEIDVVVQEITASFDSLTLDCNDSLTLDFVNTSTSNISPTSWQWQFGTVGSSTQFSPSFTFPDTGQYTVQLIAGAGALCPDTTEQVLDVYLRAVRLNALSPQTVCLNDLTSFSVQNAFGQYATTTYTWSPNNLIQSGQGTNSIQLNASTATTVQVVAVNNFGCTDSSNTTLSVVDIRANLDTINTQCNTSLTVPFVNQSTSNIGNIAYHWQFDNLGSSNIDNPVYTFPDTGIYNIQLIAGVGSLCPDTLQTQFLLLPQGLIIDTDPLDLTCPGDTAELTVAITTFLNTGNINYQWTPTTPIFAGAQNDTAYAIVDSSQTFQVVAVNTFGCRDTANLPVTILSTYPTVAITANPDTIFAGQSSQLNAIGTTIASYDWKPDTTLSSWTVSNPVAQPRETKRYYLTVTSLEGCQVLDSIQVVIKAPICDLPTVFIPNAFSPNGDGSNDIIYINGASVTDVEWRIYNRWGELVFETNDQNIGWDGTFKGAKLPPDVYGYYAQVRCADGGILFQKGNITLLK